MRPGHGAHEFVRGVGNLCIGGGHDARYDPRRLIDLLLGLATEASARGAWAAAIAAVLRRMNPSATPIAAMPAAMPAP